jgi:hypothetical protein
LAKSVDDSYYFIIFANQITRTMSQNHHSGQEAKKGLWFTYFGKGGAAVFAFLWIILALSWVFYVVNWG